jgi:hypothetical protein
MSEFTSAMRAAVATAALIGGYAWTCPATATADSNSAALAKMLSKGYTTSNCTPNSGSGGLVAFKCGQNPLPGGPMEGEYTLYGNSSDTAAGFRGGVSTLTVAPCASGDPAPGTWHYDSSPNTSAGQVACGTIGIVAMVVWTNDQNHMLGMVGGSDPASLYQWWQADH